MGLVVTRLGATLSPNRVLVLVLACADLLAVPEATADAATCACKRFAWNFNRQPKVQLKFQLEADARGVNRRTQYRIRKGIYDWEVGGYVSLERDRSGRGAAGRRSAASCATASSTAARLT